MATTNGVILQFFHWYNPADGSLWNELAQNAQQLADAGFTALWLPPAYKGNSGGLDVGYAVYDMYDLGEFDQKGSVRTKYGTKDELVAATHTAKDAGLQLYWDVVLNHRIGGDIEEEILATPFSDGNRHEQIDEPRKIKSFTHFTFPGRAKKYSDMEWHWWHFTAVDTDANDPDYRVVFLFEGKEFDEQVDLEKGSFDYLMGCDVDVKHPGGIAVLISNGDEGCKSMQTTAAHQTDRDISGNRDETITTDDNGWAEFRCNPASVSVWIPA